MAGCRGADEKTRGGYGREAGALVKREAMMEHTAKAAVAGATKVLPACARCRRVAREASSACAAHPPPASPPLCCCCRLASATAAWAPPS